MEKNALPLHRLAWLVALLPFVTIHVSYLLAASGGNVPWCVPYWDSCTSISATGRELPEKVWFKVGMIPAAIFGAVLWWCAAQWRRQAGPSVHQRTLVLMPLLGALAAICLIAYTAALGEEGDAYRMLRRFGVVSSFAVTFLAQVMMTRLLGELAALRADPFLQRWHGWLLTLNVMLLLTGIASLILDILLGPAYGDVGHAFEWVMALLINLYFAGLALLWSRDRPVISIQTQSKI